MHANPLTVIKFGAIQGGTTPPVTNQSQKRFRNNRSHSDRFGDLYLYRRTCAHLRGDAPTCSRAPAAQCAHGATAPPSKLPVNASNRARLHARIIVPRAAAAARDDPNDDDDEEPNRATTRPTTNRASERRALTIRIPALVPVVHPFHRFHRSRLVVYPPLAV